MKVRWGSLYSGDYPLTSGVRVVRCLRVIETTTQEDTYRTFTSGGLLYSRLVLPIPDWLARLLQALGRMLR